MTDRPGRLHAKRAFLVGAGSGIGRAVVDAFLAEGASVAVLERDERKAGELAAQRPEVLVVTGDATSMADTRAAVEAAVRRMSGIDVLAGFVGLFDYYLGLGDLTDEQLDDGFDEAFRTNVKSLLVSVKACLPHLQAAHGSVVLTASTSSFAPGRGGILYVSSKFAVRGAVESLARELAPEVRVNAVAPGGTAGTDLRGLRALGQHGRSLGDTPGREADLVARTPLHVALTPADIAASYVFLASDESRGMTGRFLHPDGGASIR